MGKDHALGAVIGAFIGDAVGAPLEFTFEDISAEVAEMAMTLHGGGQLRIGAGQFTDDSELAMCQINALQGLNPRNGFPGDELLKWYREWANTNPFDIGTTTTKALSRGYDLDYNDHLERVEINKHSKANGSMMRMTPLCVWVRNLSLMDQMVYLRKDSQLTHPNQTVMDACMVYGTTIASLIKTDGDVNQTLEWLENTIIPYCKWRFVNG